MKKPILTKEEIKWMMDNMDEVVSELRRKSELVKNFYQELEIYRFLSCGYTERKETILCDVSSAASNNNVIFCSLRSSSYSCAVSEIF